MTNQTDSLGLAGVTGVQVVVKSYPDGFNAIWHGWKLGFGAMSGACACIFLAVAGAKLWECIA
jgi:hypothetical protein